LNRKIKVDKGTHIFVNGNFDATIDDFKVGDFIGLEYHILDDSTEILANQIRISKKIK
jgi:adenylate cyclase class IV